MSVCASLSTDSPCGSFKKNTFIFFSFLFSRVTLWNTYSHGKDAERVQSRMASSADIIRYPVPFG